MSKERLSKAEELRKVVQELLVKGEEEIAHPLDAFVHLGARYMLQVSLEQEIAEFLGRAHYQRGIRRREGYRNGYEPKGLKNSQGILEVFIPQLRETKEKFQSRLVKGLKEGSDVLNQMVMEMYVRGLSTRDVEGLFQDTFGKRVISKSGVSEICNGLTTDFNQWRTRDLQELSIVYLFLDGIYFALRQRTKEKEGVLCAYGITQEGRKVLIHLDLGERESYDAWLSFLHNMVARGLQEPLLVIHDGNPGLKKAVREVFPQALKQRCQAHKMRNILCKLPKRAIEEIKPLIWQVFRARSYEEGIRKGRELIARYKKTYPSAMECLEKDLEECLTHLKFPKEHHKSIRTTNLLERTFQEGRRRTKVMGRLPTETSTLRLVYAILFRVSQSWQRIKMTAHIVLELQRMRQEIFPEKEFFEPLPTKNLTKLKNYATIDSGYGGTYTQSFYRKNKT